MRRALLLAVAALVLAGCGAPEPTSAADLPGAAEVTLEPVRPVGAPMLVQIPTLQVEDDIIPVGLNPDGSLVVPPVDKIGWYDDAGTTPSPGEDGPALLAGHVNYEGVTGSLARIGALSAGDRVHVVDELGMTRTFEVYQTRTFHKAQVDWNTILANTPGPELRLVTCSGRLIGHSYEDNTVVYAREV